MNYKSIKKKNNNGKIAITALGVVLVVALLLSGFAVLSDGFTKGPEFWFDKNIEDVGEELSFVDASERFEDVKLLNVQRLEELEGVSFNEESFSYTGFKTTLQDVDFYYSVINLDKAGDESDFDVPAVGDKYNVKIFFNGEEREGIKRLNVVKYWEDTVEGNALFSGYTSNEVVVYLLPYFYTESVDPLPEVLISALYHHEKDESLIERHKELVVDGYCLVISAQKPIEEIGFIQFEKVE